MRSRVPRWPCGLLEICAICAISVSAALASACTTQLGAEGALGNGTFDYRCIDTREPACDQGSLASATTTATSSSSSSPASFPRAVARGSEFGIDFAWAFSLSSDSGHNGPVDLVAASDDLLSRTTDAKGVVFRALATGPLGIYAVEPGGRIADFTHVDVVAAEKIGFEFDTTNDPVFGEIGGAALDPGKTSTVHASAIGANDRALAGTTPCTWSTSNAAVATVAGVGRAASSVATIVGVGGGTATITATFDDGVVGTVDVTVSGPALTPDGGADASTVAEPPPDAAATTGSGDGGATDASND